MMVPSAILHAQTDEALPALVQLLAESQDAQFQLDLLKGMSAGLQGRREVPMPAGWEAVSVKLSLSDNEEVRQLTRALSLLFGSTRAMEDMRRQLLDTRGAPEARLSALRALIAAKDGVLIESMDALLADPALRATVLRGLGSYEHSSVPQAILKVYGSLDVERKRDALNTLVSRASYANALLEAVRKQTIPQRDLTADLVRQLRQFNDEGLNRQVEETWGVSRDTGQDMLAAIARLKTELQSGAPGDASRGRAVFARTCQQCHALFGMGGQVGPDITGSNRSDLDYILHNMMDPNAEIPNEYRTSTVETKDDRVLTGIVQRHDFQALSIVTANDVVLIPRGEIQSIQESGLSMMPEGLLDSLRPQEVCDLVAYLATPTQVPMEATPENLISFFNGSDLSGWDGNRDLWNVEGGEIVGRSPGLSHNEWLTGPLMFSDFRFECSIKLTPNSGNSGIQFRSQRKTEGSVKGYQADVGEGWWGKLYEEHGRALLWSKSGDRHVQPGDWNTYEILAVGHRIQTFLNGHPCVDMEDPDGALRGILAFQIHSGGPMEVRIRDMKLELDPIVKAAEPSP